MTARIWVDIPTSKSDLRYIFFNDRNAITSNSPVRPLMDVMMRYGLIPKDDPSLFGQRIALLREVKRVADSIVPRCTGDLALYAGKLGARASAKADYLTQVQTHLAENKDGVADPQTFLKLMEQRRAPVPTIQIGANRRPNTWQQGKVGDKRIGMQGGVLLERVDPFHRETEVHLGRSSSRIDAWETAKSGGVGVHLKAYAIKVLKEGYDRPFLAYLESTPICHWRGGSEHGSEGVDAIKWSEDGGLIEGTSLVTVHSSRLYEETFEGQCQLFDTTHIDIGKGATHGTKAYVWTISGDFVVGIHSGGSMHHSSLQGGRSVRCAGMIGATQGRVHYVDTNSGHYRPDMMQLRRLIGFLDEQQLLEYDALTVGDGNEMLVRDFLLNPARTFAGGGVVMGTHRRRS